jgi:hypothetical protein
VAGEALRRACVARTGSSAPGPASGSSQASAGCRLPANRAKRAAGRQLTQRPEAVLEGVDRVPLALHLGQRVVHARAVQRQDPRHDGGAELLEVLPDLRAPRGGGSGPSEGGQVHACTAGPGLAQGRAPAAHAEARLQ